VIPNATVTVLDEQTSLTRTVKTSPTGTYSLVNLPIGCTRSPSRPTGSIFRSHSTLAFRQTHRNGQCVAKIGQTSTTVEVDAAPLMNAVDTTVGYVMDTAQIDAIPLPTGALREQPACRPA